jgi:hypothetical protein
MFNKTFDKVFQRAGKSVQNSINRNRQKWRQPECSSAVEWITILGYIHMLVSRNENEVTIIVLNTMDEFHKHNIE